MKQPPHKKPFLVLGPESSGTRLVTKVLMECGCQGSDDHEQEWDQNPPTEQDPIVWRRSVPHRREWPHISKMVDPLGKNEYNIKIIITARDWHCMAISQVNAEHVPNMKVAYSNIKRAYATIFNQASSYEFFVMSYESLCAQPLVTTQWLATVLGLNVPESIFEIRSGNDKYYDEKYHEKIPTD